MRPVLFVTVFVVLLGVGVVLLVRGLHPEWWRIRAVKNTIRALPVAILVASLGRQLWAPLGAMAVLSVFLLLGLFVTLPISGTLAAIARFFSRRRAGPGSGRRELLVHATVALPGAAVLGCLGGAAGAIVDPIVRRVEVPIARLPAELEGLKILQITDAHLGRFFGLATLEEVLAAAERHRPDLVVMTGDFSDDPSLIRPGLERVRALRPRLGVWASLGNHEYYLPDGARRARREFDKGDVPLLVDEAVRIRTGTQTLLVAGANDPALMGVEMARFLGRSVDAALAGGGSDDVTILLSHRPDAFDAAASRGVALTLAGHTHGGQIGLGDRSAFERLFPEWYLRGLYRQEASTLYTSTGFGHWLPLRIDCPAEAPVLVLTKAG